MNLCMDSLLSMKPLTANRKEAAGDFVCIRGGTLQSRFSPGIVGSTSINMVVQIGNLKDHYIRKKYSKILKLLYIRWFIYAKKVKESHLFLVF